MMVQDAKNLEFPTNFDALWIRFYIIKEIFDSHLFQLKILYKEDFLI